MLPPTFEIPPTETPTEEPWLQESERRHSNLKGSQGGKNYSHVGGINSSFEDHLFGACDPHGHYRQRVVLHEKPVHRLMQVMFSKGFTMDEIAQQVGYTKARVADVLRQPWAQMNVVKDIKASVQDEIKELLERNVLPTIKRIVTLTTDETAPHAVRLAASKEILDRFLGRPNQPITTTAAAEPAKLTNQELESRVAQIVAGVATPAGNPP